MGPSAVHRASPPGQGVEMEVEGLARAALGSVLGWFAWLEAELPVERSRSGAWVVLA
jgi:hypothetical protein